MSQSALEEVLAGSEDKSTLWKLYVSLSGPKDGARLTFCRAWESLEFLSSDGFENLFEQETRLEDYADALAAAGMPQLRPIFDQVQALVPDELRRPGREDELFDHLHEHFDDLKRLASQARTASKNGNATMARYVRLHGEEFRQA